MTTSIRLSVTEVIRRAANVLDPCPASRTRVSRAYYAAYLEARSFCETHLALVRSGKGSEHQEVPRQIAPIDPQVMVGLTFLRKSRNMADYDLDVSAATMTRVALDAERMAAIIIAALDGHAKRLEGDADGGSPLPG